jgi:L-ascorbate peroxidase
MAPVCAQQEQAPSAAAADRRAVLLGLAGAAIAAPLVGAAPAEAKIQMLPVSSLTIGQRTDIIKEVQSRSAEEFKKVLTAADAPAAMKLLLHDAGTYDRATGTGGCDGSIVIFPEELDRPENRDLKPFVEKLKQAKAAIDARRQEGQAPLSWADTIVLAAKTTQELAWREDKISKAADPAKGAIIADGFGNPIRVRIGRVDATEPAPAGRIPADGAALEEVQAFFNQLGAKAGKRPPLWERQQYLIWPATQADQTAAEEKLAAYSNDYAKWKKQYDISKTTVTRTSYEEDLGAALAVLAEQGANFDKDAYMCPIAMLVPNRL